MNEVQNLHQCIFKLSQPAKIYFKAATLIKNLCSLIEIGRCKFQKRRILVLCLALFWSEDNGPGMIMMKINTAQKNLFYTPDKSGSIKVFLTTDKCEPVSL